MVSFFVKYLHVDVPMSSGQFSGCMTLVVDQALYKVTPSLSRSVYR